MNEWSEPTNDGTHPKSVVRFLVSVLTNARGSLATTDGTVQGGRRTRCRLIFLPLQSLVFELLTPVLFKVVQTSHASVQAEGAISCSNLFTGVTWHGTSLHCLIQGAISCSLFTGVIGHGTSLQCSLQGAISCSLFTCVTWHGTSLQSSLGHGTSGGD